MGGAFRRAMRSPDDEAARLLRLHHAGRRVLVADDNPITQDIACGLLGSVGLVVDVAADGLEAVDLVLARAYDMVLMDLQMPGMDGLDATRTIRRRLGPGLPIVALTANAQAEDRRACQDAGMDDHLVKPVNPDHLYATVLRWLPGPAAAVRAGADLA